MTLSTAALVVKKSIFPVVLLLVFFISLVLIYVRYGKKSVPLPPKLQPPTISQSLIQKQPQNFDDTALQLPKVPADLPVYHFKNQNVGEKYARDVANSFGLTTNPRVENTSIGPQFFFNQDNLDLAVNKIEIRFKNYKAKPQTTPKTEGEVLDIARNFIDSLKFANLNLKLDNTRIFYLTIETQRYKSTTRDNAKYYELFFNSFINDLPILTGNNEPYLARMIISKQGNILEAHIHNPVSILDNQTYPLKKPTQALNELMAGGGKLISAETLDEQGQSIELFSFSPVDINKVSIKKIYLAYFLSEKENEMLQPVYVFVGSFTTPSNKQGEVTLYVPAVK